MSTTVNYCLDTEDCSSRAQFLPYFSYKADDTFYFAWAGSIYHWQYILYAHCFWLASEMAIYALGSSQQALAYLRLAQYFHFSCCKRKIRWGKAWNCHHQRALPTITQLWFKAKWQSIIELSGAAYGLFTEFRHTAGGVKRAQVFTYS